MENKIEGTKNHNCRLAIKWIIKTILIAFFTFSLPLTVLAIGKYGVNLAGSAYQTTVNPFYAKWHGSSTNGAGGQCTWYAWGRAYEKLGVALPCRGHANSWTSEAANAGFRTGTEARANSIMVEHYDGTGHVFFVESVENGYAYVSEGNWTVNGIGQYHEDSINLSTHRRTAWPSHPMGSIDYIYLDDSSTHNPVVTFDGVESYAGKIRVWGWAYDPDDLTRSIKVHVYVNDNSREITANVSRPDVDRQLHVGEFHGFDVTFSVNERGTVRVCTPAINIGPGDNVWPEWKNIYIAPTGTPMEKGYERTIPDGDYLIVNSGTTDKTSLCYLDINGTAQPAENGTNVAIWGPATDLPSYEAWTVKYKNGFYTITQKGTSKALEVTGGSIDVGANVLVYESNSTDAQKWAISTISNHGYRLQAKCSGLSLDVAGGGTSGGTNVRQFSSNDSYAQSWLFIPYEPYQPVEDGRYILLSGLDDGLELDVAGDSGDVGNLTNIQVWGDYAASKYNSFDITKLDNGYYKIIHAASGKAMDVNGGLSNHSSNVSLFNDNGSIAQQWAISKKDGYYVLKAKCSGYALDVEGGKTADGTNVSQYPYNGNTLQANQSWKLVPAEYTISYDANGGENAPSSQTKYYKEDLKISSDIPEKEGFLFVEWNAEPDGMGTVYNPGDAYADDMDIVLYAQYVIKEYTVSYNANGGYGAPPSQKKNYKEDISISWDYPDKEGYDFIGWNTEPDGTGVEYLPDDRYSEDRDLVLYAQYKENKKEYKCLKYHKWDSGEVVKQATCTEKGEVKYTCKMCGEVKTKILPINHAWDKGIVIEEGDHYTVTLKTCTICNETKTIKSAWDVMPRVIYHEYTVSYNANGGNGAPSKQTKYDGESLTISMDVPEKDGYTFKEWNTKQDGTGVSYAPGDMYADESDLLLFAQYEKIPAENDGNTESVSADNTGKPYVSSGNQGEDDENTEDEQNNSEDGEGNVSEKSDDNMNSIISDSDDYTEEVSGNSGFTDEAGNEEPTDAEQKETVTTPDNTNPSDTQDTEEAGKDESPYTGISVSDNKPMEYKTETVGSYEISYCHQIPFWGKSAPTAADFGDIAVCYNGQSYKVTKVKVNKKKHRIQILNVEGADTKTEKEIKNATKGDKGLIFQVNPYFVTEDDKVEVSIKNNGKIKSLKIQINDKEYKAKKSEYDFDKGSGTITFKGDNLKGSYAM